MCRQEWDSDELEWDFVLQIWNVTCPCTVWVHFQWVLRILLWSGTCIYWRGKCHTMQPLIATQGKQLQLRIPSLKGMTDHEAWYMHVIVIGMVSGMCTGLPPSQQVIAIIYAWWTSERPRKFIANSLANYCNEYHWSMTITYNIIIIFPMMVTLYLYVLPGTD